MYIYCLKSDIKIDSKIFNKLMEIVDDDKKISSCKRENLHVLQNSLLSNLLAKYLIHKLYDKKIEEINFKYNEYGKPLINSDEEIYFNISHSSNYVVCAIDNKPVGIDLEKIRNINLKIADRFFTKEECEYINEDELNKLERFFDIWTMKESFIKAIGLGLSTPLNSFNVSNDKNAISHNRCKYYFHKYCIDKNYRMSVCCMNTDFCNKISYLDKYDFINDLLL